MATTATANSTATPQDIFFAQREDPKPQGSITSGSALIRGIYLAYFTDNAFVGNVWQSNNLAQANQFPSTLVPLGPAHLLTASKSAITLVVIVGIAQLALAAIAAALASRGLLAQNILLSYRHVNDCASEHDSGWHREPRVGANATAENPVTDNVRKRASTDMTRLQEQQAGTI